MEMCTGNNRFSKGIHTVSSFLGVNKQILNF